MSKNASLQHEILCAIKGFRNGVVYGVKIRAPHALVMTFLFSKEPFHLKLLMIARLTYTHAKNLSLFTFGYKLIKLFLKNLDGKSKPVHAFIAAALVGYTFFGSYNAVNMQVSLYLFSRIALAISKTIMNRDAVASKSSFQIYPWCSAVLWGLALYMFENHPVSLQPSLKKSMVYLYHDSNKWSNWRDFLFG